MKTKNLILPVVALLFSLAACEVEEPFSKRTEVVEGLPVTVTIPFATKAKAVVTRAAQDEELENRVNNAYLLIFDEAGNKIGGRYCTQGNGMDPVNNTLETDAISQNRARIVGIANLNDGSTSTAYDLTPAMLDAITTYDQLCSLQMKLSERSVQRGSTFIMTGVAIDKTDENNSEWVQIPGSESGTVQLNCRLRFERTDAKVKFVVNAEVPEDKINLWEHFSFQPKEWRVCKVPAQALVIRDAEGGDADGEGTEYFSSRAVNFEEITRDPLEALYQGGSFVFYMPENKKSPKMNIPDQGTEAEQYALRDKQDKNEPAEGDELVLGQEVVNGEFTYANENSTYVEMTGTLSYEYTPNDNQSYYVEADVRYVIHLGYASGDPNDYDTDRNCNYTYTVTVRGINDIEVEVTADPQGPGEVRPGAEGDVIYSRAGIFEFDAHYDRRLITIDLSEIPDGQTDPNAANGVTWGVRTPFSNGIYDLNAPDNLSGIEDYKWVKFAINSDYGVDNDKFVKYPGDQNYNDLRIDDEIDNKPPGSSYEYDGNYQGARLLDVKQFVERINEMKQDPNKPTTVAVTVFIDEYVYYRDPVTYTEDLSLWKYSVDQPDRMMYIFIVPGDSKYSPDGESLVINSVLTFRQKSLRTIYDVNNPDLTSGKTIDGRQGLWGLESVMETGRLETGGRAIANGSSRNNGRLNTLRCMLGTDYNNNESLHWSDVLNTSDHYAMKNGYENALYACLMRNRDLNGDNIVQANEIRWYLASVNQLVDIYIGEYALDREAWLYPENPADRDYKTYWHYTTSTYNNGNPEVLWSEEGASLGSYGASQSSNGNRYAYRCVRNLGIALDNPDTEPLPLYTYTETTNGEYLIDVTRLTPNSRRENFEPGYLPEHTDIQISNLPYAKFQVQGAGSDIPAPKYEIEYYGPLDYGLEFTNEQTWEECLQYEDEGRLTVGYRLPNQRELLIMLNILPDKAWRSYQKSNWYDTYSKKAMYMCKTRFSRAGEDHFGEKRLSFRMNANDKSIGLLNNADSDRGYIRAVKDVRE